MGSRFDAWTLMIRGGINEDEHSRSLAVTQHNVFKEELSCWNVGSDYR